MNWQTILKQAETMIDQQRMRSAKRFYEEALCQYPEHKLCIAFSYGALNQMFLGNGEEARRLYQLAISNRSKSDGLVQSETLDQLEANTCENMMLLSLSYEEYDTWANRLEKLQPQNEILSQQKPLIRGHQDSGFPWSAALQWIAKSNWDVDPSKDPGMYGAGASIYQLMLKHRGQLRTPRDEHRAVAGVYAALLTKIWANCGSMMESALGAADPEEFNFILTDALPLVEEYAKANPADEKIQESLRVIKMSLEATAGGVVDHSVVRNPATRWHTNSELAQAIYATGVSGLQFELVEVSVGPDGDLRLKFKPLSVVPAGKKREAGLALRCVVGLTFPAVASSVNGFQVLLMPQAEYLINLGSGVRMQAYWVQSGATRVGPFQVTSDESDGDWYVYVIPFGFNFQQVGVQHSIFSKLVSVFEKLKHQPIILQG